MTNETAIQCNSVRPTLDPDYAEHAAERAAEYKRVMSIGFPSGNARDAYWLQHKRKQAGE